MALIYHYKLVERPKGLSTIKTPSIPITLKGELNSFDTLALLDSGADLSVISKDLAEILGLDLSGKKDFAVGVGGKVETIDTKLQIQFGNAHEKYTLTLPIKVILSPTDFNMLIGRKEFFDKFTVIFEQEHEKIILKRNGKR